MGAANLYFLLFSGIGMMLVAMSSVAICSYLVRPQFRWYWVGAGIWFVAVVLKVVCALIANPFVLPPLKGGTGQFTYLILGSLYLGIESSIFEMGITLAAVLVWRQLAQDATRGIAIGVGAGAFEALLLGLSGVANAGAAIAGVPGTEIIVEQIQKVAATTPLFFLLGPAERTIAILCHVSTRALILLGAARSRPILVVYGFVIFTLLDGVAGGAHLSGAVTTMSMWWIELAILPFAIVSVPIIRWCHENWNDRAPNAANGWSPEAHTAEVHKDTL